MKTNVINVDNISVQRAEILKEAEAAAAYSKLSPKATRQLRLLTEELTCMVPELLDFSDGKFWMESEDNDFSIILELKASSYVGMDIDQILAVSTSGKNSARGFVSKIKDMLAICFSSSGEDLEIMKMTMPSFYTDDPSFYMETSTLNWSLDTYKNSLFSQQNYKEKEEWDELEKSIIASIADDVKVSIAGKSVRIEINKNLKEV